VHFGIAHGSLTSELCYIYLPNLGNAMLNVGGKKVKIVSERHFEGYKFESFFLYGLFTK